MMLHSVNVQIMRSRLHNYISDYFPMGWSQLSWSKERWESRKHEEAGAGNAFKQTAEQMESK